MTVEVIKYYVLPWKDNLPNKSFVSQYLNGNINSVQRYNREDIRALYHTHPRSSKPSQADKDWSDYYKIPIYTIGSNGNSYYYFNGMGGDAQLQDVDF